MEDFKIYLITDFDGSFLEGRPWVPGEDMTDINYFPLGYMPTEGFIYRNHRNHKDQWFSTLKPHERNLVELTVNIEFTIWMEGYAATGESGTAQIVGKAVGKTFDDAVRNYMKSHPKHGIEENTQNRYTTYEAYLNRRSNWNIWACNLYSDEAEARKSFG